jgi:hypothetical protein
MAITWSRAGGGAGTFYIASTSGLYQLLPGGSWTLVAGGNGYTVSDVVVDPLCTQHVYAALGFIGPLGSHRGGILFSKDNGATWTSITSGYPLHNSPISSIQIDPMNGRYLWAATYGLGGWFYDSGTSACP